MKFVNAETRFGRNTSMKNWLKGIALFLGALILIVSAALASFLVRGGAFRQVQEVSSGVCKVIPTNHGSAEDIDIDPQTGIAYLSALDRRGLVAGKQVTGDILQLDLSEPKLPPTSALNAVPDGFRPHGVSLFEMPDGSRKLFVINHQYGTEERIEVFSKAAGQDRFEHQETLSDPLITHPNDLVAVGPRQFYIANDSGASSGIERGAEMLFGIGLSPLVYFDGSRFSIVDEGLKSSGGINTDLNTDRLYVGETMGNSIRVYELNPDRTISEYLQTIDVGSGVDNIDIEPDGTIWIANHSNTLALVQHFADENLSAPLQVQKIEVNNGLFGPITTVLENNGDQFSANSVAAKFNDLLAIGSITEPAIMLCDLDA
jgi:arylesterase/paraoxonase